MRMQDFTKKAQVEAVLGHIVSKAVEAMLHDQSQPFNRKFKRTPLYIEFHKTKPTFNLHDFETMDAYMVDLKTGELSKGHYCGSGVSTINHQSEQLAEGETVADGYALVFLTQSYGGNGNTPWYLNIVTQNITSQIEGV